MRILKFAAAIALLTIASCQNSGGTSYSPDVPTDSPPIVSRVDPNSGAIGDEITIFGFGFTVAVPENIVIVGGAATTATSYTLLSNITADEIESITATIPADAQLGEGPVYVQVYNNVSNADVSFTVTP